MRTPLVALSLVVAAAAAAGAAWWALRDSADGPRPTTEDPRDPDERALESALFDLKLADSAPPPESARALRRCVAALDALASRRPGDPTPSFWRGVAAVVDHDRKAAEGAIGSVATRSSAGHRDARVQYLQAVVTLEFDPERAEAALKSLRALRAEAPGFEPTLVEAALYRALLAAAVARPEPDRLDESIAYATEAVTHAQGSRAREISARRILAQLLERASRYPEAEELWAALARETGDAAPEISFGYANVLSKQNRWDRAIEQFGKVVAAVERGSVPAGSVLREARMRRGNCHRLLGELEPAKADLERYVADHPDDHRGVYWLGMLWLDGYDDAGRAVPFLEKAWGMAPWCDGYADVLVRIYEVRVPDAARAEAVRKERDARAEEHKKTRERLMRERKEGTFLCQ